MFKQKTAYEMRSSDWSSDVCSSDLGLDRRAADHCLGRGVDHILAFRPGIDPFAIDVELVDCREGDGHAAAAFLLLRMMSAAFMATAMAGALVLPDTMVGMMGVSTTRSPSTPRPRSEGSTTEVATGPIRQEIGRAAWRERGWENVEIGVDGGEIKNKK